MTSTRNTSPANVYDALRRLRACNKQELAEALGVSRHTLKRWEELAAHGEPMSKTAALRCGDLLRQTLQEAGHADVLAQWGINWDMIQSIGGRR